MNRYLVFYGDYYYPSGGMGDFIGDFNTLEECRDQVNAHHSKNRPDDEMWEWAWHQIWDSVKRDYIVKPKFL